MDHIHNDSDFLKTLTLLYVEDDPDTCAQLAKFLRQRAATLITAAGGAAGMAAFQTHRPDIVITDIQMPGMDGLTMAREIRGLDAAVPVIVTTAFEQTDYLLRAIDIGVDKYVAKPVDPDRLYQALLECAYRFRAEAERAELEAQNRQLQKAESLGRMAGAIAHHFNNQLQTVMGNLEMALDLSEICRRSLPMLCATLPKDVILKESLPSPGPAIHANENQIRQVLTNLISNGRESMDGGGMAIGLMVKTVSAAEIPASPRFPIGWLPRDNAYACLEVSDTGCGIPAADIEKIFDPFYTSNFTGRGLGLPTVLGIVRTHGGAVTVESEPGRGSIFRVYLPVTADAVLCRPFSIALPAAMPGMPQQDKSDKTPITDASGMVLLVEDEELIRVMARAMLTRLGHAVLEARDGVEAVEMFRQHRNKITCVLCDLIMPRMDGWKTLAALREIAPGIPVILSSGFDKEKALAGVHSEWPQAFLGKPYKAKDLREAIVRILANPTEASMS